MLHSNNPSTNNTSHCNPAPVPDCDNTAPQQPINVNNNVVGFRLNNGRDAWLSPGDWIEFEWRPEGNDFILLQRGGFSYRPIN